MVLENIPESNSFSGILGRLFFMLVRYFSQLTTPSLRDTPPLQEGSCSDRASYSAQSRNPIEAPALPLQRRSTAKRGGGQELYFAVLGKVADKHIVFSFSEAKNSSIAVATVSFFNEAKGKKNRSKNRKAI